MDKYAELKKEYEELQEAIGEALPGEDMREDVLLYYTAVILKIWSSNVLYSPDYAALLSAVSGTPYTIEQVMTAMGCCADAERKLKMPVFLTRLLEMDCRHHTENTMDILNRLSSLLAGSAMINGDFTVEEASELSNIMGQLLSYCTASGLHIQELPDLRQQITEKKEESYLQNDALAEAARKEKLQAAQTKAMEAEKGNGRKKEERSEQEKILEKENGPDQEKILKKEKRPEQKKLSEKANEPKADTPVPVHITINLSTNAGSDTSMENTKTMASETSPAEEVPAESQNRETMESLLAELDSLVGLKNVKQDVHSLMNFIKITKLREKRGMKVPTISYHLVFTGNPGTGKTTVARLVAKLYYQMGILPKGQLVEADRSTLVAGYLGQTAIKTQKVIQQALGGLLFIDEAYSLAGETNDSYGKEAIETILKAMEDHRDELVVVVAGYTELMHKFIDSNPGLSSRFSKYFEFTDYTGEELSAIFNRFCETNGYTLEPEAADLLRKRFAWLYENRDPHFGNARSARNIFEKAINTQADRIAAKEDISDQDLEMITVQDIISEMGEDGNAGTDLL